MLDDTPLSRYHLSLHHIFHIIHFESTISMYV